MKSVFRFLKPYIWPILAVVILTIIRAVTELLLPNFLSDFIKLGIDAGDYNVMWKYSVIMLIVIIIGVLVTILSSYLSSTITTNFGYNLRIAVYEKVSKFSIKELNDFTVSSLITRNTQDIQQLQMATNMSLRMVLLQPILAVGGIVFAIKTHAPLSIIIAVGIVSLLILMASIFIIAVPKFSVMQKLHDKMNLVTRETLSGVKVVRAFDGDALQEEKFDEVNKKSYKTGHFINVIIGLSGPFMTVILGLVGVFILYIGVGKYLNINDFGYESLITLNIYATRVIMAFMMMSFMFIMIPRALVSAKRVAEVLNTETSIKDPENPLLVEAVDGNYITTLENNKITFNGSVEFIDVNFKYPDAEANILEDISFKVNPGETVAFIGSTGSGKSTLINLIPRFYDVTSGQILIDGVNIKDLKLFDLRNLIGYIPQQGFLFTGSIRDNVRYGQDLSDDEVWEALDISQGNFVKELDGGLDYEISQGGKNVSGGQRQRLSIARAVAKKPLIYIFDDSFSALDYKTDALLRKRLKDVRGTKLIVAQRVATVMQADKIIVLHKGRMLAIGKHKELLKTCHVYREIAESQLQEEDLL
ncbi:MAG TPA: ABC transporter ATP-binding protein [Acholeplasmataceae bacterium]|jgi:ATP-binding cassette subfamily B multidrug efflux pump|nr:ABC transporter ATP-binding protein [Acholeplasmataceae bacterium]